MAICDSGCAVDLPLPYSNGCGVETKPGGINRIGFIKCDYDFTDITDQVEWDAAIAAGDAVWSGLLTAQKPKGSFTNKRVISCAPERPVGGEKSITFMDYGQGQVHDADGCAEYDFWNTILANPAAYRMVYITCDGCLYGPIDDFTIEPDEIIEDSNQGLRYIDGTIKWNNILMECPTLTDLVFDQDSSVI